MKKPIYPKLIKIFFTKHEDYSILFYMAPTIFSSFQNKPIIFDYDTLGDILGISKGGHRVFEVKIILIIEGFYKKMLYYIREDNS